MIKKLNWKAYTSEGRNNAIEKIKEAISVSDGYILNFNMFSDLAMSLAIEIEECKIIRLHNSLSGILKVSDLDEQSINVASKKEWLIFLNLSFSSGKGELKKSIPAVPG